MELTVKLGKGTIRGKEGRIPGNRVYLGIPYGKAPEGDLRFLAPLEADPWEGVKDCLEYGPSPVQEYRGGENFLISEDCLSLNVFTSASKETDRLPVLVWFFGGAFSGGRTSDPEFDGEPLAEKGAVVVTVNYRVNVFGFFSTKELEKRTGQAVNAGLADQVLALHWVQDNIERFGGDPSRVMIFGQSAGGVSVRMQLVSPLSKGLFSRAVVESGGGLNEADLVRPREEFQEMCDECLKLAGWTLDDLLSSDAVTAHSVMLKASRDLLARREIALFQPFVDGVTLTDVPGVLIAKGQYAHMPIICGTVAGDSWMFSRKVRGDLKTVGQFRGFALAPGQSWGRMQLERDDAPIRTYYMDRKQPARKMDWSHGAPPFGADTPHGSEIAYFFGTLDVRGNSFQPLDYEISETMQRFLLNFAATGNPNSESLPSWPFFGEGGETLHIGDSGIHAENVVTDEDENRAITFTMEHPGMLTTVEGF